MENMLVKIGLRVVYVEKIDEQYSKFKTMLKDGIQLVNLSLIINKTISISKAHLAREPRSI